MIGPSMLFTHAYQPDFSLADIAGANAAGWSSILVRTGVYDPSEGPPTHTPTVEAADVEEAVTWAIEREAQRVKLQA